MISTVPHPRHNIIYSRLCITLNKYRYQMYFNMFEVTFIRHAVTNREKIWIQIHPPNWYGNSASTPFSKCKFYGSHYHLTHLKVINQCHWPQASACYFGRILDTRPVTVPCDHWPPWPVLRNAQYSQVQYAHETQQVYSKIMCSSLDLTTNMLV
jgi:hypothetical protein